MVVLIQEIFGVDQAVRTAAAWAVDLGFIAVCPDGRAGINDNAPRGRPTHYPARGREADRRGRVTDRTAGPQPAMKTNRSNDTRHEGR